MVERKQLGDLAIQYFRKTLADGDRLAKYLLRIALEQGTASVYLPSEVDVRDIADFKNQDDFLDRYSDTSDDRTLQERRLVCSHLNANPENVAIWEGWPERPEHPHPRNTDIGYFWNNEGIWGVWDRPGGTRSPSRTSYAFVSSPDEQRIEAAFKHARPYPTVCALTVRPTTHDFASGPFVASDDLLAELAATTQCILVGAFDERACLIWTRR
jgi:hypothetical protein